MNKNIINHIGSSEDFQYYIIKDSLIIEHREESQLSMNLLLEKNEILDFNCLPDNCNEYDYNFPTQIINFINNDKQLSFSKEFEQENL
tara:strand:- start:48 stop:311 length:264 start_codon:yes stop_codon:yes gene_type:complete